MEQVGCRRQQRDPGATTGTYCLVTDPTLRGDLPTEDQTTTLPKVPETPSVLRNPEPLEVSSTPHTIHSGGSGPRSGPGGTLGRG